MFLVCRFSASSFFDSSFAQDFRVILHNTGEVSWAFGGSFATTCNLDLKMYPFDKQSCSIQVENWAYTKQDVFLFNGTEKIVLEDYQSHGIWSYTGSDIKVTTFYQDIHVNNSYPRITFTLHITRKSSYYLTAIMVPCILILCIELAVFWLPPDSGEKIGLGVTVVLAFSVFQIVINSETPATSDNTPVIGEYYIVCLYGGPLLQVTLW